MKLIADALIELPFTLDFCAKGPDVQPLTCRIDTIDVTLFFPPSMSDGTDGKGIFGDWAWWTGKTLRIVQEREVESVEDVELLREIALTTADEVLRRFLNSYRWRFNQPGIHPVRVDPRVLTLEAIADDGAKQTLSEPVFAFFYQNIPDEPPLETSVNNKTLDDLQQDVRTVFEAPLAQVLELDAQALEEQGEYLRADLMRGLARQQID